MSQLLQDIISTSFGGAFAGLALFGVQLLHTTIKEKKDSAAIYKWMQEQRDSGGSEFRSTRAIASFNNLTEDRVRYLCSHHPLINMSTGQAQDQWSISARAPRGLWG